MAARHPHRRRAVVPAVQRARAPAATWRRWRPGPRAVDGGWVLDGQKVWTSYAQFADWGVCLARTDPDAPKHRGISYLVVDMHAPGVEVRPLVQLTGEAEFNEVFLSGVFVPADQLVGPEHEGWRVANSTLSHERGTNPRQLVIHMQLLEELLRLAAADGGLDDVRLRQRLAQAYVEVRLFQLHNLRSISRLSKGLDPGPEGSALKLYWSEMSKRLHDTAMAVLGRRRAAVATAPTTTRATASGSGRGSTTRRRRSSRAPTRSSATSSASGCSACPAARSRRRPAKTGADPPWHDDRVVRYSHPGHVATITMNRPEVANAQDTALIDGIDAALDRADADDEVRVVILAGNGKHFSSGHDLKALVGDTEPDEWRRCARRPRASSATSRSCTSTGAAALLVPQADHRRRARGVRGGRPDAGLHVRPHRGRRRRHLPESGAADDRRRGGAAGRAVGARHPQGQGVPLDRREARRPGGVAPRAGQPGGAPGRARPSGSRSWPTGWPWCRRPPPRW